MSEVEFEENIYYEQSDNPDVFSVEIIDNPAAAKCNLHGDYEFHVCTENFAIVDSKLNKRLYTWPFRHIRRYGKSSTNFQFEAGRKSQSGEGLFSLLTREGEGEAIFDLVQERFSLMKQRDREYKGQAPQLLRDGSYTGPAPTVPRRQYENKTIPSPQSSSNAGISKNKPPSPPKPNRSSGAAKAPKPQISSKPTNVVPASQIHFVIAGNRQALLKTAQPSADNTYDVMGQEAVSHAPPGAYQDVYGSSAASRGLYADDTNMYDEVNQP